jgi:hypothetical protein
MESLDLIRNRHQQIRNRDLRILKCEFVMIQ